MAPTRWGGSDRSACLLAGLTLLLACPVTQAEQFVLFDVTFTFTKEDADTSRPSKSHYYVRGKALNPDRPKDWTHPVDYRNGTVHIRTEVIEKPPGGEPTTWTLCYIPNKGQKNGYGCTGTVLYREQGVYEQDVKMTAFWQNDSIVWSEGIKEMHLVIKDGSGGGGHAHKRADADKFFPTTMRITMVQVSAGSTYAPEPSPFTGSKPGEERAVAGVKLCWCPPGRFTMGSPPDELERRPGEDQVAVTLTRGFWAGKYEVTQGQWKRVVGPLPGPLTAELPEGDDYPVGNVNFAEAEGFCAKLTELGRKAGELPEGWEFRLPTEAQWEYACRAGTTTATAFGDRLGSKQANVKNKPYNGGEEGPALGKAARVGGYPANAWGIHDMHGNIVEWCRDWFHARLPGGADPDLHDAMATAAKNRTGDLSRSRRGSAWTDDAWASRSAFRQRFEPARRYDHIGFRVVAVRR
jgi:formylglycine-generating enzyme